MTRIKFNVTDEVNDLLHEEADKRGIPMAEVIRLYVEAGLAADGYTLSGEKVKRGGDRKRRKPKG